MTGQSKFLQLATLVRVVIPSLVAGILAYFTFPFLSLSLASLFNDAGIFAVLSQDSSQFVQNFLTVSGLLFSILVGQTFYFMYQQQEMIYLSLFEEVTEAKSLLEQTALLCGGRPMYFKVLKFINNYLQVSEPRAKRAAITSLKASKNCKSSLAGSSFLSSFLALTFATFSFSLSSPCPSAEVFLLQLLVLVLVLVLLGNFHSPSPSPSPYLLSRPL
jgi:hypothetical protein